MQQLLDLDVALELLLDELAPHTAGAESVPLEQSRNRVTAVDIHAPVSLPPFRSSAMDGYAVRTGDFNGDPPHSLAVEGTSFAGQPYDGALVPGQAVRIFTGAALPHDADAVIIQEDTSRSDPTDLNSLQADASPAAGLNVREIGNDIEQGGLLVPGNQLLGPFQQAWLNACGIQDVEVVPKLRVSVFSTGDELVEPGEVLRAGQIYESNRRALTELMKGLPVEVVDLGILPDNPEVIRETLAQAATSSGLIMTSGGVSVGDADYVREVVESIGHLEFWKLALKPGKPLAYGRINDAAFFGLPGNPVSTVVTFLLVVRPAIQKLAGMEPEPALRVSARLQSAIKHTPGRAEYQRGMISNDQSGLIVASTGDQGSNRLGSFRDANCLIEVPKSASDLVPGANVNVLPFSGLIG